MSASSSSAMVVEENLLLLDGDHNAALPTLLDPFVVMILTIVAFVSSFFFCGFAIWYNQSNYNNNAWTSSETGSIEASFCFIIATFCFLLYGYSANAHDKQEYHGKMRIVGYEFEARYLDKNSGGENDNPPEPYTAWTSILHLDWGYDWACLDDTVHCTSDYKLEPTDCRFVACFSHECTEEENEVAQELVRNCTRHKYFNDTNVYTPFNPFVGPSQDVDWPNILLFGDCDSCQVIEATSSTTAMQNLRISGYVFFSFTLFYLWIFIVLRRKTLGKKTILDKISRAILAVICCCNSEFAHDDDSDDDDDDNDEDYDDDNNSENNDNKDSKTLQGESVNTEPPPPQQQQQKKKSSEPTQEKNQ